MTIKINRYINVVAGLVFIFNFFACETTTNRANNTNNPISKDPETCAIVQSIEDFNTFNHQSTINILHISYYVDGKLIESSISFNSDDIKLFNKGDSLKIAYKKNNPRNFQINSSNNKLWLENEQKLWQLMQPK